MDLSPDTAFDPAGFRHHRSVERSKRRRTYNHRLRVAAQQAAEHAAEHYDDADHVCEKLGLPCWYKDGQMKDPVDSVNSNSRNAQHDLTTARRLHLQKNFKYQDRSERLNMTAPRPIKGWNHQTTVENEDVELAHSTIPLPSDRNRLQRHPSLGREDAFCDASTFKGRGKVHIKQSLGDEDAQIAELYRMGLLYDENDAEEAKAITGSINLNTIYHDQPAYTIRPAKRSRKLQGKAQLRNPLDLDLSFADLGADDDLSRYLLSAAETTTSRSYKDNDSEGSVAERRHTRKVSAPLRVVYELDNNSQPSFDVDTSQPPDLIVDDSLSDYDCFTESDMDEDLPSQEVDGSEDEDGGAAAATASGAWVLLGDDS